ncbi:MAG: zinc ribbon domain-containing protein [Haloarculaceae archaeon]
MLTTSDGTEDGSGPEAGPETVHVCPACSSEQDDSSDHCEECGAELGPGDDHPVGRRLMTGSSRYCSNCKSEVDREANACPSCGAVF